jgi:sporulation protein YlmC with PRC-barrel domain
MNTKPTSSATRLGEEMGERMAASSEPVKPVTEQATGQGGVDIVGARDFSSGPGPEIMAADTLEGDNVVNRQGETLGEIKHIMIDVPQGRVAYAVLSFGGILGIGDKLFAIPWSALTLDAGNHQFILDVPEQRLRDAPGFDKDHWPSMADERWASEVHSYYNTRPYWGQ